MLGALGALIRKDDRTLFNKTTDGLFVSAPKLSQEMEYEFTEDLGYEVQRKLLDQWDTAFAETKENQSWCELRQIFQVSRLRILYTSEESHEWILYTNSDFDCLCGVYQKFNFEFGDGKFHDIVSMGTTQNIAWNVLTAASFDPLVLCNVGNVLNLQRKINTKMGVVMPAEIWHVIMGFAVDCFQPISKMMEVDIVLRDVRRWTQNLYLSENLRRMDDGGDDKIRKFGQLFIEIGSRIDSEYIKYKKQFSLRKKFVRFMKYKFTETSQKFKNKNTGKEGSEDATNSTAGATANKKAKPKRHMKHLSIQSLKDKLGSTGSEKLKKSLHHNKPKPAKRRHRKKKRRHEHIAQNSNSPHSGSPHLRSQTLTLDAAMMGQVRPIPLRGSMGVPNKSAEI